MKKKILLLIEDNPLLTGIYKTAFEKKSVEVLLAHDGESGIALAQNERPDVIVLDLLMPGIDGFEVLQRLKKDAQTKDIKVVVLTILTEEEAKAKAKKLGAVDYLIKSQLKLQEIVERVLAHF